MRIIPVSLLKDNYAYMVISSESERDRKVCVVDPSEAQPVLDALAQGALKLDAILCTHHHLDHVGGVEGLVEAFPRAKVYASWYDIEHRRIPVCGSEQPTPLCDADVIEVCGLTFRVLSTPGHTLGALVYLCEDAAFTGDTLFGGGCGRLFEGTADMMFASLQRIAALPKQTRLYWGHEYTLSNLRFAHAINPDDPAIQSRIDRALDRSKTVPSTLQEELETNPFLRARSSEELRDLRSIKDRWNF